MITTNDQVVMDPKTFMWMRITIATDQIVRHSHSNNNSSCCQTTDNASKMVVVIYCTSFETFVSTVDPLFIPHLPELLSPAYVCEPYITNLDMDDDKPKYLVPSTVLLACSINNHQSEESLLALMDLGSDAIFIERSKLPPRCTPSLLPRQMTLNTATGTLLVTARVVLEDAAVLPHFSKSLQFDTLPAYVFDAPDCCYNVIVARNSMLPNNFDLKFSTQQMEWYDCVVPIKHARQP
jgi:hypothetical protein